MKSIRNNTHFILIAGFSSDNEEVFGLRDILEEQGFSTNALSFYGDLKFRDFDEINMKACAESISRIINEAIGKYEKVVGIGISLGGALLLEHAKNYNNLSGIVSIGTPFRLKNKKLIEFSQNFYPLVYPFFWKYIQRIKKLRLNPIGAVNTMLAFFGNDLIHNLEKVNTPVLFLHSKYDKVTDPKAVEECMAKISSEKKKIKFFENGNHVINYNPMIVREALKFFEIE